MSANREDALTGLRGLRLPFDSSVPSGRDPTEDLADEITSELGGAPAVARNVPVPGAEAEQLTQSEGVDNVLRDRYVLEMQLGAGGTAVVFRAVDLRRDATDADGRRVAIKVLRPELRDRPHAIARLQREFRQSQAAAHAGVVRVFDLDCDRGTWFIVMELLSGETLGPALRRAAPSGLPAAEALRIAESAADALAHAHAVGVIHGDVKPDNIFLTGSGELRVLDFGVAPESAPEAGDPVPQAATRVYASPEVLAGSDPAPRDDVFSLACVTYEMLAGVHPYGRRGADQAVEAGGLPARIESLDEARWSALEAALSLGRDARPDMASFARALRGGERRVERAAPLAPQPPERVPVPVMPQAVAQPPAPRRGRQALLAALAAGLALLVGIYIGRVREPDVATPPPSPAGVVPQPVEVAPPEPAPVAVPPREVPPPLEEAPKAEPVVGPPGIVFFGSPRMIVSKNAVVAAIPMRNLSKVRRAATVHWQIIEGTARVDRDFAGPMSGTESFIEGNSFRIRYIPILQVPAATRDRRFTVEMTGVSAGTELGPTPRIEVTILGAA
jgi:serine/threonine protein kinase